MTTVHSTAEGNFSITKGAPDILLSLCTHYERDNKVLLMTEQVREEIRRQNRMLSGQALRVLAVAYQKAGTGNGDLEQNLVFYGLLGSSPVIATISPDFCRALTMRTLCSGETRANTR